VTATPRVVALDDELLEVAADADHAPRLAVDLEASGMFAYRARTCTVQLSWDGAQRIVVGSGANQVVIQALVMKP